MTQVSFHSTEMPVGSDIVCDELGTPNARQWQGTREQLGGDLQAIMHHQEQKQIRVTVAGSQITLSGLDRVGLIMLPSGRRIVLQTKITGIKLIEWLIYLGEFPQFQSWAALGNVSQSDSWQIVVARLFLQELQRVTQFHLRKEYVAAAIKSSTVKGRIRWAEVTRMPWQLPRLPQVVRERRFDTPANQMLAAALQRVLMCLADLQDADRAMLFRLRHEWAEIASPNMDRQQIIQTSLLAPPDGYRTALQLARLILVGASFDSDAGSGGQAFTLSLSRIWEIGLKRMCQDRGAITGWSVAIGSDCNRTWDDAAGTNDPFRCMRVDTLLVNGQSRWVLDAKYKRAFGDESRSDRFQVCAYAIGFRAERATLAFPYLGSQPSPHRVLLTEAIGDSKIQIDSIALPMADGPDECKRAFCHILDPARLTFVGTESDELFAFDLQT